MRRAGRKGQLGGGRGQGASRPVCVLRSLASMLSRSATGSDSGCPVRDRVGEAGVEQAHGRARTLSPPREWTRDPTRVRAPPDTVGAASHLTLRSRRPSAPGHGKVVGGRGPGLTLRLLLQPLPLGRASALPSVITHKTEPDQPRKVVAKGTQRRVKRGHGQVLHGDNDHYHHRSVMTVTSHYSCVDYITMLT